MMVRNGLVTLACAVLLIAGCANRGGSADSAAASRDEGSIQTSGIRSASATKSARNESRPLSELNTPEAIAAREAAARSTPRPPMPRDTEFSQAEPPRAMPETSVTAETETALANSDPHKQVASLQKGGKVRMRSGATLRSRPSASSERVELAAPASELLLGPQVYNADGYWWYVTAGKDTGWASQVDLLP